jgi:adenylate kinase
MKIFITGTPGTGKTTLGKALKERIGLKSCFEIKELLIRFDLLEEYEPNRDTTVFTESLAIKKIQDFLKSEDNYILVGPPLQFDEINFSSIIVLVCSVKSILYNRLAQRGYKESKIVENIEAELLGEVLGNIMDYFSYKSQIHVFDSCTSPFESLLSQIMSILN